MPRKRLEGYPPEYFLTGPDANFHARGWRLIRRMGGPASMFMNELILEFWEQEEPPTRAQIDKRMATEMDARHWRTEWIKNSDSNREDWVNTDPPKDVDLRDLHLNGPPIWTPPAIKELIRYVLDYASVQPVGKPAGEIAAEITEFIDGFERDTAYASADDENGGHLIEPGYLTWYIENEADDTEVDEIAEERRRRQHD